MMRRQITICIFILGVSGIWPRTTAQDDCGTNVGQCVDTAFEIFNTYADDIKLVCRATDEFLTCIVNETKTCDPLVAASIKDSMSPMIDMYTAEPYNCVLDSATNEALQPDVCSEEMSVCSVFYFQATSESAFDTNIACSMFELYLDCMQRNTTSCHGKLRDFIEEHTANATREFDQWPYFCEERINYAIDEVDKNMTKCNNIMESLDIRIIKQDYVCGFYRNYFNCAIGVLSQASPRQFEEYVAGVNEISLTFRVQPYFCESDEPCMELFRSCNASAQAPGLGPCRLMDVYTTCLTNGLSACAEDDYADVASRVQQLMGDIHNKYNCIEENKNKHFDDLTTTPHMEPTSKASGDDREGNPPDKTNTHKKEEVRENNNNNNNNNADTPAPSHKSKSEESSGSDKTDSSDKSQGQNNAPENSPDKNDGHVTRASGSGTNPDATPDNAIKQADDGKKNSVAEQPVGKSSGPRDGNVKNGDNSNETSRAANRAPGEKEADNGAGLTRPCLKGQAVLLSLLLFRAVMT